ncbi:hypothetical protein ACSNOI_46665, partial [Actinomadura kijaniata]|uniref:hypothetical protein n=1 Tax=Actinomadura kijaniata TaxID=46161 RepID=UPI003F1A3594
MSVLVDPIAGWLGSLLGNAWLGLLRGSPDERLVKESMAAAVEQVLSRIQDPGDRQQVRAGLGVCFTRPPAADASDASVGVGLRAAVAAQVDLLRQMGDGSRPFFELVSVDPDWLRDQVAEAFVAALERAVAASSITETVHQIRHDRLEDLIGALLRASASAPAGPQERLIVGVVPPPAAGFQQRQVASRLQELLAGGGAAVLTGHSPAS